MSKCQIFPDEPAKICFTDGPVGTLRSKTLWLKIEGAEWKTAGYTVAAPVQVFWKVLWQGEIAPSTLTAWMDESVLSVYGQCKALLPWPFCHAANSKSKNQLIHSAEFDSCLCISTGSYIAITGCWQPLIFMPVHKVPCFLVRTWFFKRIIHFFSA